MMYNKIVEEYFFLPKHIGILDLQTPLTVHFASTQKNQSITRMDLHIQCTESGLVCKARFKATGNPYVIAALEWLCRQMEGKKLDGLEWGADKNSMSQGKRLYQVLVSELEIPQNQYPIALQVEEVYKELLVLMKKKFEDDPS